ncbi:MAG: tRNA pseudouridine(55) synthase TruB [Candidatus Saccharimonadales bacterium]
MKDVILIDKPAGWTSFDVVARIRSLLRNTDNRYQQIANRPVIPVKTGIQFNEPERSELPSTQKPKKIKVGHAGTLDPFATGLLIILVGDACKDASSYLKLDKTYEFTAKLGEVSSTGDPEGEILEYGIWNMENGGSDDSVIPDLIGNPVESPEQRELSSLQKSLINNPTPEEVQQALRQFTGEITQTPPAYSAIKINGKRAYKLAREGKSFEIPSRKVTISRLQLVSYEYPYLKCICDVSSGTYIRSLVEDIGKTLKTGAYCTELRRTRIGNHQIEDAQILT